MEDGLKISKGFFPLTWALSLREREHRPQHSAVSTIQRECRSSLSRKERERRRGSDLLFIPRPPREKVFRLISCP